MQLLVAEQVVVIVGIDVAQDVIDQRFVVIGIDGTGGNLLDLACRDVNAEPALF